MMPPPHSTPPCSSLTVPSSRYDGFGAAAQADKSVQIVDQHRVENARRRENRSNSPRETESSVMKSVLSSITRLEPVTASKLIIIPNRDCSLSCGFRFTNRDSKSLVVPRLDAPHLNDVVIHRITAIEFGLRVGVINQCPVCPRTPSTPAVCVAGRVIQLTVPNWAFTSSDNLACQCQRLQVFLTGIEIHIAAIEQQGGVSHRTRARLGQRQIEDIFAVYR